MPAEGGIPFGPYLLQRRIARGGMAEVFLAQQRGPDGVDRRVAVKRILPHHADAPDFIQMFLAEAQLASQLGHPNIVQIYDFGRVASDSFIAMEFVDGVHAGEVIRAGEASRLSPAMVARIGADAAAALHYAHELRAPNGQPYGLVHRDVSPANLMLSFDGMVKLCDFGIAKAVALGDRPLTRPGLVKGKYAYMSPEQTVGTPLDGRSDVYALAIVLWELLAGRTLVPRGDAVAAMHAIRLGNLPPIGQVAPWTPAPLVEAVSWALATNRDQRPTAAQLAAVLEQFLEAASESATSHQLGGWLRAHFPRTPADPTGEPEATEATPSTPSALSTPFAQAALSARAASSPGAPGAGNLPASAITSSDETSTRFAVPRPSPAAAAPTLIADDAAQLLARSGFAPLPTDEGPIFAAVPSQRAATAGGSTGPAQTGFESTDPPGELPVLGDAAQGSATAPGMPPSPRPRSPSAPGMPSASPLAPASSQHAPPPGVSPSPRPRSPSAPGMPSTLPFAQPNAPAAVGIPLAPSGSPFAPGEKASSSPPDAPSAPRVSLPSLTGFDHAETILRSGAFRAPVPSGPASVPTLLEGPPPPPPPAQLAMPVERPVQMRARPMPGAPMLAGRFGAPQAPARLRIGRVVAVAFGGVALVIAIVFGAWRCSHEPRPQPSMFAPRDAGPALAPSTATAADPAVEDAAPADAAVSADADADTPADADATVPAGAGAPTYAAAPADAAAADAAAATATTAAAGPMATLDVHTAPAGATVMIRRCRRAVGKCTVDRASAETPIGDCPAAPCAFALPPGSYEVVVELGGAREARPVKLMTDVATSLDIVFKPAQLRRAGMGRLTLHAPQACKALLDGKTRVQAPLVDYELKVGAHRLELQCGRRPWPARSVTIAGGKTTSVTLVPR